MNRLLAIVLLVAGCGGTNSTAAPATSTSPSLSPVSQSPTSAPISTIDPALADAVADALATINEIDRLYDPAPTPATFRLLAEVATAGRTSLSRGPARVTTMKAFHVYDLLLQLFEQNAILMDASALTHDHNFLVGEARDQIEELLH